MINLTTNGKLKVLRDAIEKRQAYLEAGREKATNLERDMAKGEVLLEACRLAGIEYDAAELDGTKTELENLAKQIEQAEKEIDAFERYAAQLRLEK